MNSVSVHDTQGFTIIELLIYLAVTTVAIMTITSFMVSVERYAMSTKVHKAVQGNTRFVMSRIGQDIRNAVTIDSVTAKKLILTKRIGTNNVSVQYVYQDVADAYCPDAYCVEYIEGVSLPVVLTASNIKVASLVFSPGPSNDEVSIAMTLRQKSDVAPADMRYSLQTQTTVVRRRSLY